MNCFSITSSIALVVLLGACGGGGGGSAVSERTLSVTPALGGVSAGVNVAVYDASSGKTLGAAVTQISSGVGSADVSLPLDFAGIPVVRVSGCTTCTYLDERTFLVSPFPSDQSLLAILPPLESEGLVQTNVSPLTSMVAGALGITSASFSAAGFSPPATPISDSSVKQAVTDVLEIFGLAGTDTENASLIFSKPVIFGIASRAEDKLSGTGGSLSLGILLTALAQAAPTNSSLLSQSESLSAVMYENFQDPNNDVKEIIRNRNLISDLSEKISSVTLGYVNESSSVNADFISKAKEAGGFISSPLLASAGESTLAVGLSTQLKVKVKSSDNSYQTLSPDQPTYLSSDKDVLTVTSSGLVNAMGPGSAFISVAFEGNEVSVRITVPEGKFPDGFSGQVYN